MKRIALIARKFSVDSQVLSAMFLGYFVLLVAGGIMISRQQKETVETASEMQIKQSTTETHSIR
jgi:hypothetical protein